MFKKIMNHHEEVTSQRLVEVCAVYGASAYPKIRVADILPIENSGISDEHYSYAMKAHFDFVVCNSQHLPQFAVEFDGPVHNDPIQRARDVKKNELCEFFGLPMLRINSNHLSRTYKEYDLLTWCVENWFLALEFEAAQKNGQVSWDEPYDPMMFITLPGRKERFPMWLASEVRLRIQKLSKEGKIAGAFISDWIGVDANNNYHGIAWVKTGGETGVYVESAMRKQNFPVSETDLLGEILCFQIVDAVEKVLKGEQKPERYSAIMEKVQTYAQKFKERSFAGYDDERPEERDRENGP